MKTIKLILVVTAVITLSARILPAGPQAIPFLPSPAVVSTVPPNGDLNPYGVAFVPHDFNGPGSPLQPKDILVSNFNNMNNLQGTGTTIVRIGADGSFSTFFTTPNATLGGPGTGLTTALAILKKGIVIVGSMPSSDGTLDPNDPGSLLVIDGKGNLLTTITDSTIDGPWDMTVDDRGGNAFAFVSNALNGTVVRLDLQLDGPHGVKVTKRTVIASGYQHQADAVTFVDAPTGLVYDLDHDMLFVASSEDNAVYAVQNAEKATRSNGKGSIVYTDATHLHGALGMAMAPNGHFLVTNNDAINSDPNQPSEIVEFTVAGQFVTQLSVDPNQGGSFGLAVNVKDNIATFAAVDDNTPSLLIFTLEVQH
jgi:hypothetical protein